MSALRKPETAHDPLWESFSAAFDGEGDDAELGAQLDGLKRDADLRAVWGDYQLIGDSLRGHAGAAPDFMANFSERLAAEPTVLAPRRSWLPRAAVASVALLAAWGVATLTFDARDGSEAMVAELEQANTPASEQQLAPYLVMHQEYAPVAVASPYQRAVLTTRTEP